VQVERSTHTPVAEHVGVGMQLLGSAVPHAVPAGTFAVPQVPALQTATWQGLLGTGHWEAVVHGAWVTQAFCAWDHAFCTV
jgi:hypothetical protein